MYNKIKGVKLRQIQVEEKDARKIHKLHSSGSRAVLINNFFSSKSNMRNHILAAKLY